MNYKIRNITRYCFITFIMTGWVIVMGSLILMLNLLISQQANSAEINGIARIEIVNPISFITVRDMDFGTVVITNDETASYTISPNRDSYKTGNLQALHSPVFGEYIITSYGSSMQLTAHVVNESNRVRLNNLSLNYDGVPYCCINDGRSVNIPTGQAKKLLVGGTYTIGNRELGEYISEYNIILEVE